MMRITPQLIKKLSPNEIFVFGSNKQGHHAGGAALYAVAKFGAEWGNGFGLQGQSYAIPTLSFAGGCEDHMLSLAEINGYVQEFIAFAKQHPEYTFLVTPIGCGIAGFTAEQIAPMFKKALRMKNVYLPETFINVLKQNVLQKMITESINKTIGDSPIIPHESDLNIFTMPTEHRNHPLMEGYFATYKPEVVKKYLDKRYGDGANVSFSENENKETVFRIVFSDSDYNQNIVDKDMSLCGYFPSYIRKENGVRDVQYEPRHQNKINDVVRETGFIYHLTPTEKVEKILSVGLCPKSNNKMFMYPNRIYAFLRKPTEEECRWIIKEFYKVEEHKYHTDKKLGKKAVVPHTNYTLIEICVNNLNINWYYDPNAEECVYTKENIPPQNIKVVGKSVSLNEGVDNLPSWIYCGIFLREQSSNILENAIRKVVNIPEDWKIYCHHMTLGYNNGSQESREIFRYYLKSYARAVELTASKVGVSDKAIAVAVEWNDKSGNKISHITVATSPNGKPVDSNFITDWNPLPHPITLYGKIGYFGKDKQVHGE